MTTWDKIILTAGIISLIALLIINQKDVNEKEGKVIARVKQNGVNYEVIKFNKEEKGCIYFEEIDLGEMEVCGTYNVTNPSMIKQ